MRLFKSILSASLWVIFMPLLAHAGEVSVAAASNFSATLDQLVRKFEAASGHHVRVSKGSTGKLYAQIANGAPFDVFLAADSERPMRIEQEKLAVAGSRFTYAIGRLVLWSPKASLVDVNGQVLKQGQFQHLAIANPKTAPYGTAARETLENLGLLKSVQAKLVQGEDIGQTLQFVASGNAELGFVSLAQIKAAGSKYQGSYWLVPQTLHMAISQQAVLLEKGRNNAAAHDFLIYMKSNEARAIIDNNGYATP